MGRLLLRKLILAWGSTVLWRAIRLVVNILLMTRCLLLLRAIESEITVCSLLLAILLSDVCGLLFSIWMVMPAEMLRN